MKKLVQEVRTGKIELLDVPSPEFKPGFLIVRTIFSAISRGTELSLVEFLKTSIVEKARRRPKDIKKIMDMLKRYGVKTTYSLVKDRLDSYMPLGYSLVGEVLVADEESEFQKGDIVACGGSEYASHQEIACVPVNMCAKVPLEVALEEASFTTIGSIAIWALREANIQFGERGLVIGLGLLGILSSLIMDSTGVTTWGVDIDDSKNRLARLNGINAVLPDDLKEGEFDFVIVSASSKDIEPLQYAINKVRRRGRVVIVGSVPINLERNVMYEKEVKVSVSRSYGPGRYDPYYEILGYTCPIEYQRWNVKENMKVFLRLLSQKKLDIKKLITHRFDFNDAPLAYDRIKKEGAIGAIFVYSNKVEYKKDRFIAKRIIEKDKSIKVSVIGAGTFLRNFILPNLSKRKDVILDIVCNERPETTHMVAKKFGFSSYTTSPQVVSNATTDLIIIGTRHNTHGSLVKEALLKGKGVFVEKPLTLNLEEVYEIKDIIEQKGGFLHVGFNRRFSESFLKIKEFIEDSYPLTGIIRVLAGSLPRYHWAKIRDIGGDRIVGEVCHFIDAAVFLTGSLVKSVFAKSIKEGTDFDDNLQILLSMENGSLITIMYTEWGNKSLGKEYYELHQSESTIILDNFQRIIVKGKKDLKIKVKGKGHENEVRAVIEGFKQGKSPIPTNEIFNVSFTVFAIRKSLREGREIFLKEF